MSIYEIDAKVKELKELRDMEAEVSRDCCTNFQAVKK